MEVNENIFSISERDKTKIDNAKSQLNDAIDKVMETSAQAELHIAQKVIDTLFDLENNSYEYNFLDIDDFRRFFGIHTYSNESVVHYMLRNYSLVDLKSMIDSYLKFRKGFNMAKEVKVSEFDSTFVKRTNFNELKNNKEKVSTNNKGIARFDMNTHKYVALAEDSKYYQLDAMEPIKRGDVIQMHFANTTSPLLVIKTGYDEYRFAAENNSRIKVLIGLNTEDNTVYEFDMNEVFKYVYFTRTVLKNPYLSLAANALKSDFENRFKNLDEFLIRNRVHYTEKGINSINIPKSKLVNTEVFFDDEDDGEMDDCTPINYEDHMKYLQKVCGKVAKDNKDLDI